MAHCLFGGGEWPSGGMQEDVGLNFGGAGSDGICKYLSHYYYYYYYYQRK